MNTKNTNANSSISNEYDRNSFEYQIDPRLHFIGHLNELEDLLKIFKDSKGRTTNSNNNKSSWSFISANRNATLNEMKEKYFNWRQAKKYISNSTLQRICEYVAIDYYVFDSLDLGSNSINNDNDDNNYDYNNDDDFLPEQCHSIIYG
jgi:hypothetical protein